MKKIGILTYYYGNYNYGGLLQAYALTEYLSGIGYDAEQICFIKPKNNKKNVSLKTRLRWKLSAAKGGAVKLYTKIRYKNVMRSIEERNRAFLNFIGTVKHSDKVYDRNSLHKTNDIYDVFIAGSDQIWNLVWYAPEYFLSFVNEGKTKLSYAASLPQRELTPEQAEILRKHLADFKGVSVRESQAVDLLQSIGIPSYHAADPTLLLNRSEWDKVCPERKVKDKYVFCYFLTNSAAERNAAKEFAKKKNLKIVTLPHLTGVAWEDLDFGDIQLYDISPFDFVSLIKHAEYVITDSFHAAVFSNIYKKQYFVFGRKGGEYMNSRINSLLFLLDAETRLCNIKDNGAEEYLLSLDDIDYSKPAPKFEELRRISENFLKSML